MKPRHWPMWIAVILLWALFAQATGAAARTSLTIDEGLHIASGYTVLRTGDFRLLEEHPPLVKMLAALPLLFVNDLPNPTTLPGWQPDPGQSDTVRLVQLMQALVHPYRPIDRLVFAARVPIALLAVLLGAAVFRWGKELGGKRAGLLALFLLAFDPNIVAHAAVAATDLGTSAFIFFASYTFWRALRRPSLPGIALAGLTLGLAQAAKISALVLLPVFVALAGLRALRANDPALFSGLKLPGWARTNSRRQAALRLAILVGAIFALAFVILWAIYGFELRAPPSWNVPVPAASHLIPFSRVQADVTGGRTTFLMGQYSQQGWWYYFPVAFAIKTPLPTLILLLAATVAMVYNWRKNTLGWSILALLAFPVVYFAISIAQPFNIGYRHLLPILPFLFVFIGVQIQNFPGLTARAGKFKIPDSRFPRPTVQDKLVTNLPPCHPACPRTIVKRVTLSPCLHISLSPRHLVTLSPYLVVSALFIWYVVSAVLIFPHHLAFFNELVGGPDGGYHYLVDSNVDWGQAWKELEAYMDAHGIARIKLAQFSSNNPAVYEIDYEPIAPMSGAPPVLPARFNPAPGVYVLSASSLQGLPLADINSYDYFRHRRPSARIGHAMFVYDIRPTEPLPGWVASCTAPTPPLEPADLYAGLGRNDMRLVYFDCQQSWVIPGNSAQGWFVLPYALAHDQSAFAQRWLNQASLTFEQKQSFEQPPFSIFMAANSELGLSPASAMFGQTAELVGYALNKSTLRPGQSIELLTAWRVIGAPPGMLSVMAHAISPDGAAIAVGDGLGFTSDQWQVGDIFIQRSLLEIPAATPGGTIWIQTGLYTWDNLQRLEVTQNGNTIGDSLRLAQLSIEP